MDFLDYYEIKINKMAYEFRFPDVGEGIHEGQLLKWLVKEGDKVKEDQAIAEVETDKAVVELPSPVAGTIFKLNVKAGSIIKVGEVIVTISKEGEKLGEVKVAEIKKEEKISIRKEVKESLETGEVLATLKVRKLAQELNVDLTKVKGTGPRGRILESDVNKAAETKKEIKPAAAKVAFSKFGSIIEIPLSNIRKTIAEKMSLSHKTTAQVTQMEEIDITELAKVRERENKKLEKKGLKLTFLPYIVKAVIEALKEFPHMNSSFDEQEQKLILKKYYNIGIAVDTPEGLIVPNIKNADEKSIMELSHEIYTLSEKARSRNISLNEIQGGTFTITNIGSLGGTFFTPIINYPEVAILGIGRTMELPRVVDGKIEIRKIMPVSLSFDHRAVDGAEAMRFLNEVKKHLEDTDLLFIGD